MDKQKVPLKCGYENLLFDYQKKDIKQTLKTF